MIDYAFVLFFPTYFSVNKIKTSVTWLHECGFNIYFLLFARKFYNNNVN